MIYTFLVTGLMISAKRLFWIDELMTFQFAAIQASALSGYIALRVFTSLPIPGWTTLSIGPWLILIAQLLATSLGVILS